MVMVHGDDKGLVLPPRVAPLQVVIVYILKSSDTKELADAIKGAAELVGTHTQRESPLVSH